MFLTLHRVNYLLLVSSLAISLAQASPKATLNAQLPLFFEPNRGQAPSEVRYLASLHGMSLLLEDRAAVLRLPSAEVRMRLTGTPRGPQAIEPLDPLPGTTSYFIGNKPAAWRTGIPQTGRIRYKQVYPGIDMVFKAGGSTRFEYDFVIAPQADPSRIAIRFDGAESIQSDGGGIILHTKSGDIRQPRPNIYQDLDSGRREIPGRMILANNTVRFELGDYDHTRALVIDPLIIGYLVGNVDDEFSSIARDSSGNVYVAGASASMLTAKPFGTAASGYFHALVVKLTPDLSTIPYLAVIGGNLGEGVGQLAVDSAGNAYVIGTTNSTDFPTTPRAAQVGFGSKLNTVPSLNQDAFILKLDPKGATLVYSTFVGGSGDDQGTVLTIDSNGVVYAAGDTTSPNFPITLGGLHDGLIFVNNVISQANWVAKLSADGSVFNWVAALGGNTSVTTPTGIALDSSSNVYLVGTVEGTDYPTLGKPFQPTLPQNCTNCYGGFISEISFRGSTLMASTYWGGSLSTSITGVALDSQNNVYIAGYAFSNDLPFTKNTIVAPPSNQPSKGAAYVAGLNSSLSSVLACSYLAADNSTANAVIIRAPGVIGVSGGSLSGSFATIQPQQGLSATGGAYVELDPLFQHVLRSFSPLPYAVNYAGAAAAPDGSVAMAGTTSLLPTTNGQLVLANRNGIVVLVFPGPVNPNAPVISAGGVVSASSFGAFPTVSPGSWIEIYGSNLAADTRTWASGDFMGLNAPMSLDGTSVMIGGQSAFIDYISPTQVNALVSSSTPTGAQQLIVKTAQGTSAAYNVTVNAAQPGLLAPPSFKIGGVQYAVAILSDGAYALPAGAIAGVNSRPAKPGDVLVLYGVGFGSVSPNIPAGQVVQQANSLAQPFQMSLGGMNATLAYDGLAPNFTGLFQFNLTVPAISPNNAAPLTFTLNGAAGTQTLAIWELSALGPRCLLPHSLV